MISADDLKLLKETHSLDPLVQKLVGEIERLHDFLDESEAIEAGLRDENHDLWMLLSQEKARHLSELQARTTFAPEALEEALTIIEGYVLLRLWEDGEIGTFENDDYVESWDSMLDMLKDEIRYPTYRHLGSDGNLSLIDTYRRLRRSLPPVEKEPDCA